jgi:hypothetical protein
MRYLIAVLAVFAALAWFLYEPASPGFTVSSSGYIDYDAQDILQVNALTAYLHDALNKTAVQPGEVAFSCRDTQGHLLVEKRSQDDPLLKEYVLEHCVGPIIWSPR